MTGKLVPLPPRRRQTPDDVLIKRRALERWLSDAFRHRADEIAGQVDRALPPKVSAFLSDFSRRRFAP